MLKRILLIVLLWAILSCICGCMSTFYEVFLSRSPDGQKQISIRPSVLGGGSIYLWDSRSDKCIHLMGVSFSDANERVMKFDIGHWTLGTVHDTVTVSGYLVDPRSGLPRGRKESHVRSSAKG